MAILQIFSPGKFTSGGSGGHFQTLFISSPFPGVDNNVWIECSTKYVAGSGQSDFGIHEIEFLDERGTLQRTLFGGPNSVYGALLARKFVKRFLGMTIAANTYDASIEGNVYMYRWG